MIQTPFRPRSSGAFLALTLFLSGCEKMGDPLKELTEKAPNFPITRTLTDNTGRPLEATIIGRGVNSITVIRNSDRSRFDIPFARLSQGDQEFLTKLPLTPAPPEANPITIPPPAKTSNGAISFLHSKRDELEKKLQDNMTLLLTIDRTTVKGRTLKSERKRLLNELSEVVAEIQELEAK